MLDDVYLVSGAWYEWNSENTCIV